MEQFAQDGGRRLGKGIEFLFPLGIVNRLILCLRANHFEKRHNLESLSFADGLGGCVLAKSSEKLLTESE